ncbi:RfaG Glycosyltransferase [Candidatus Nanopelagicaceae bacterium]
MRIVHLANFYGPKSGGIKTTLQNLGAEYTRAGHDFVYIVPGKTFKHEKTLTGMCITLPSWIIPFSGGYRVIRSNFRVKKLLKNLAPDRIEVSDRFTLSGIGIWAARHKIPAVVFSHETLQGLIKNYLGLSFGRVARWHNARLASRFDHIVATTDFAAKEFREIQVPNLIKIPLGVDLETFTPDRFNPDLRRKLLKGGDILLVHCGRLSPEKKPERSIEALRELINRGFNARLIVVGSGPLYKKLYNSSRDIPVTFWGYIANKNLLAEIIASADISIAPGPIETFCLAALESLASGTPVVASETSAVGEFILAGEKDAVGITAANTTHDFADAIEILMMQVETDPSLSKRCVAQAKNFTWEATASQLHAISRQREIAAA